MHSSALWGTFSTIDQADFEKHKDIKNPSKQEENEYLNGENCATRLVLLLLTPAVPISSLLYRAILLIRNWIQVHQKRNGM